MTAIEEFQALPISGSWKMAEAIVTRQQAEIDDLRRQLSDITSERDELRQQLAAQDPLVKIAEELRELLNAGCHACLSCGPAVLLTMPDHFNYDAKAEFSVNVQNALIQLRDAKGGA